MTTFEQLGLSKEIIKALKENGFEVSVNHRDVHK